MSHLFRAQWVCLKAQNSTTVAIVKSTVAIVKSLAHISRCSKRAHIHQPELSLSPLSLSLFANQWAATIYKYQSTSPQCLHVCSSARALSPRSFSLFANHNRLQLATVKSLGHISRWGAWKEHVCSSASSLSLSPLPFSLFQTTVGCNYLPVYITSAPLPEPFWTAVSAYIYAPVTPWSPHQHIYFIHNTRFNL